MRERESEREREERERERRKGPKKMAYVEKLKAGRAASRVHIPGRESTMTLFLL